jgi:hypothetical protein
VAAGCSYLTPEAAEPQLDGRWQALIRKRPQQGFDQPTEALASQVYVLGVNRVVQFVELELIEIPDRICQAVDDVIGLGRDHGRGHRVFLPS